MKAKCYFRNGELIAVGEWDESPREVKTQVGEHSELVGYDQETGKEIFKNVPDFETTIVKDTPLTDDITVEEREVIQNKNGIFLASDYQHLRVSEYPKLSDQIDALWKGGTDADEMKARVLAVKDKYPKS